MRRSLDVVYENWLETRVLHDPEVLGSRLHRDRFDVLIVEADFVFDEVFSAAPNLRLVGVCRNALNQVDIDAATSHGVPVSHAKGRNTNAVAEMTLGLMLSLARRIPQAHQLVTGGAWRDPALGYRTIRGRELANSTVGMVGFGQIGREVAGKCIALGARIISHDPFVPEPHMQKLGVRKVGLMGLARSSDFVTLHAAEMPDGSPMIGEEFFGRMKRSSFLVNTAGGGLIDLDALTRALHAEQIAGAALDVFPGHPLPQSSPVLTAPNVILTPHVAGATNETIERHSRMMVGEIERLLTGRPLRYCVNPQYRDVR